MSGIDFALQEYAFPEYADQILRVKVGATADPDWAADQIDPGAFYGTVGGTADDGDLTVTITPLTINGVDTGPTPDPIVFTRAAGETLAQSAEGLYDEAVAAYSTDDALAVYFASASSFVYRAGAAVVQFIPRPDAPAFTVAMTGTGGTMTFTLSPDDVFPITAVMSNVKPEVAGHRAQVAVSFTPLNSSGAVIPDNNAATIDVELVRVVKRRRRGAWPNDSDQPVGVVARDAVSGQVMHQEYRASLDGGRFTVRVGTITNAPTGFDALEIRWRAVQT